MLDFDLSMMSVEELQKFQRKIQERITGIQEEIGSQYPEMVVNQLGIEHLSKMPVVTPQEVNLDGDWKYPLGCVRPSTMGDKVTARGVIQCKSSQMPFILLKIDILDDSTHQRIAQVAEVIFKRHNYTVGVYQTPGQNFTDDGKSFMAGLHTTGGMGVEHFEKVRALLDGEVVDHISRPDHSSGFPYKLRLARTPAQIKEMEDELRVQHTPELIETIGMQTIMDMPVIDAKALNLDESRKYHNCVVTPEMMKDKILARGIAASNRPFIAIKVDVLDQNGNKITETVELIYKKWSLHTDGANDVFPIYTAAHESFGSDGKKYQTVFSYGGGFVQEEFDRMKRLLNGETVTPHDGIIQLRQPYHLIRLAKAQES